MQGLKNILFLLFWFAGFLSCTKNEEPVSQQTEEVRQDENLVQLTQAQAETAKIKTGTFSEIEISDMVKAKGTIELPPNNQAAINPPMEGFIQTVHFLEGDRVQKGNVLVSLQHPKFIQLQQQYVEAFSRFGYLEKELERQKTLSETNVGAQKTYQQIQADFQAARGQANALEEELRFMGVGPAAVRKGKISAIFYLRAPFTGVVSSVSMHKGQLVNPSQTLMEVINTDHSHLELSVFEKDFNKIKKGQEILFSIPAFEKREAYKGTVALVGKDLDRNTNTIRVHGHYEGAEELIPGLYVEAQIAITEDQKVKALPEGAVIRDQGQQYVFVQSTESGNSKLFFRRIKVETGPTAQGFTAVQLSEPISDGESIVTQGAFYLKSEMNKGAGEED